MSQLPDDPFMLLGIINMKLRDEYSDLGDLCASMDIDKDEVIKTLSDAGFVYMPEQNQFR